jgi:putative oxidoreductase
MTPSMAGFGLCVLRLAVAVMFVAHGSHNLFGMWPGPGVGPGGLQSTAAQYAGFGLHPEFLLATLAGITMLVSGLLLGFGLLTRWAALSLVIYESIGIWKEHWKWGFFLNWTNASGRGHGVEYSMVLVAALVCVIVSGAGSWSLDGRRASHRASGAAGRARLRGKM